MSAPKTKYAVSGFVGTIRVGIVVLGIAFAMYGAWCAWDQEFPFALNGGWRFVGQRALEWLCAGAYMGGVCGAITGLWCCYISACKKIADNTLMRFRKLRITWSVGGVWRLCC
jgi:hypothetical protein